MVKIIQIYYNDNYDIYQPIKEEIITDKVCIYTLEHFKWNFLTYFSRLRFFILMYSLIIAIR